MKTPALFVTTNLKPSLCVLLLERRKKKIVYLIHECWTWCWKCCNSSLEKTSSYTHFLHKTPHSFLILGAQDTQVSHLKHQEHYQKAQKWGKWGHACVMTQRMSVYRMIDERRLNSPWAPHWEACTHKATQIFHHCKHVHKWSGKHKSWFCSYNKPPWEDELASWEDMNEQLTV